jgi:hypothetical protein
MILVVLTGSIASSAPTTPITPKRIGMSAPASLWDQRINEVGACGVTARRIFADVVSGGSSQMNLIQDAVNDGMLPVISYKVPNVTTLINGGYDSWLTALKADLVGLNTQVTATFWHEPNGDMTGTQFQQASQKFYDKVNAANIEVGPILNGWLLDNQQSTFASFTNATLLSEWEFVAVDSYQSGDPTNPGTKMPARAIPLLATWLDNHGQPNKPIGLGEYNGFSAAAIQQAGEAILSTPEVWFGLAWNSTGDSYSPLTGDRLTAYQATKADSRALHLSPPC